jgi:hypothetical protein
LPDNRHGVAELLVGGSEERVGDVEVAQESAGADVINEDRAGIGKARGAFGARRSDEKQISGRSEGESELISSGSAPKGQFELPGRAIIDINRADKSAVVWIGDGDVLPDLGDGISKGIAIDGRGVGEFSKQIISARRPGQNREGTDRSVDAEEGEVGQGGKRRDGAQAVAVEIEAGEAGFGGKG